MSRLFSLLCVGITLIMSACANSPTIPVQVMPVARPAQWTQTLPEATRWAGLQGEELELSGIYAAERQGAVLLLRNGEQMDLADAVGRPLSQLPGVENRSSVRVRGQLRPGARTRNGMGLAVRHVVRI